MICKGCAAGKHWRCLDVDQDKVRTSGRGEGKAMVAGTGVLKPGRAYASCDCQHKAAVPVALEPAQTGADGA